MKSKPLIILGAIGAIGAIVAVAAVFVVALNLVGQQGARPTPGTPAPDFVLGAYDGYEAGFPQDLKLSNLRGKPVVVNFWASWCVECFKEADALETTYRKYKDQGVVFLGIGYLDQDKPALDYLKQYDITYRNGIDVQQRISRAFRITGVPETFFIDKNGIVREVTIAPLSEAQLSASIEKLLVE